MVLRGAYALLGRNFDFAPTQVNLVVEDGRIRSIAPTPAETGDEVVDMRGRLLVPGLINGHFHSHEHFHKGRVENLPLELWMHHVRAGLTVPLTPRQVYLRTMIGAIEALRSGTTTVVDDLIPRAQDQPRQPGRRVCRLCGDRHSCPGRALHVQPDDRR